MAQIKMVIRTATGEFLYGGFYEPTRPQTGTDGQGNPIFDPTTSIVTVPGERVPDLVKERYDPLAESKLRAATSQEQTTSDSAAKDAKADAILTDKIVLALAQLDFEERSKLVPVVGQTLLNLNASKARLKAIYRQLLDT